MLPLSLLLLTWCPIRLTAKNQIVMRAYHPSFGSTPNLIHGPRGGSISMPRIRVPSQTKPAPTSIARRSCVATGVVSPAAKGAPILKVKKKFGYWPMRQSLIHKSPLASWRRLTKPSAKRCKRCTCGWSAFCINKAVPLSNASNRIGRPPSNKA